MKPAAFAYHRPATLGEALDILAELAEEGKVLAGGQSLVPLMNFRMAHPEALIDLNRVSELTGIRADDGALVVGSMTRQWELETSEDMRDRCPLLGEALAHVGHLAIRTRGTVGGSIAHADPTAELPVVAAALGAEMVAASKTAENRRSISAEDFFQFIFDVAAVLELDEDGVCTQARIALGGVAPSPQRARAAEEFLLGTRATDKPWAEAARIGAAELEPPEDPTVPTEYRRDLARELTARALGKAAERAHGSVEGS
jgi:carbon-monoxide dehydrogenase medium subunit